MAVTVDQPVAKWNRRTGWLLAVVLALAALVQSATIAYTVVDQPLRADARDYFSYAYNLREYATYSRDATWVAEAGIRAPVPDAVRAPGYSFFLNLIGEPRPTDAYLARIVWLQGLLAVGSVLISFLIARRFLGRGAALLLALVVGTSPHLATMSTYVLTESLFTFLLLASTLTLLRAIEAPASRWRFVVCGLLWGACSLVRPTMEFLPPLLAAAACVVPAWRALRKPALIGLACFVLVMAPWLIRNQTSPRDPPQPSLVVNFLHHGSYPGFMYNDDPASLAIPYRFDPDSERIARDVPSILRHIAGRFRVEPGKYLRWYLIGKPGTLFAWDNIEGAGDIQIYPLARAPFDDIRALSRVRGAAHALHWPLVLSGAATLFLVFWRPRWLGLADGQKTSAAIIAVVVIYAIGFHMIGAPYPRYGIPFRPLLFALALLPLQALVLHMRRGRRGNA